MLVVSAGLRSVCVCGRFALRGDCRSRGGHSQRALGGGYFGMGERDGQRASSIGEYLGLSESARASEPYEQCQGAAAGELLPGLL